MRQRNARAHTGWLGAVLALAVALVVGSVLGRASSATAQAGPTDDGAASSPASGYRIAPPAFESYFQARGGARSFGYPISNEFVLLGKRVQLFQRQLLELHADGSVGTLNLLDADLLPITRVDGLTFPGPDAELLAAAPSPDSPDYLGQALAVVDRAAPDEWNGLPVKFGTTFRTSVTCADAFGDQPCEAGLLPAFALELWGLPTSTPAADPGNGDFVYQRFQRGIMHYDRSCECTQGLLLGDWFKRVLAGDSLPADLQAQVAGSRFYAQYAANSPLGLARPDELPGTSLASAFVPTDALDSAALRRTPPPTRGPEFSGPTPTAPPPGLTATALSLDATVTSVNATAAAAGGTLLPVVPVPVVPVPVVTAGAATPAPELQTPVSAAGCLGDEQMFFVPKKPFVGVPLVIAVTSQRRHDARYMRLAGPTATGPAAERRGEAVWIWEWTVTPTVEAFYQYQFFADGLHRCITSGFNAFPPLGATATPTPIQSPGATPLPAAPALAGLSTASASCGQFVKASGSNFGATQSQVSGNVYFTGPGGTRSATIISWTNTEIGFTVPVGLVIGAQYQVIVADAGGASNPVAFSVPGTPPPAPGPLTPTPFAATC